MYTNAQVADLVKALDARLSRIERALTSTPAGAPVAPATSVAATPVAIPERGAPAPKLVCAKHPDHKGGKGFSVTGMAAHRTWCDGVVA